MVRFTFAAAVICLGLCGTTATAGPIQWTISAGGGAGAPGTRFAAFTVSPLPTTAFGTEPGAFAYVQPYTSYATDGLQFRDEDNIIAPVTVHLTDVASGETADFVQAFRFWRVESQDEYAHLLLEPGQDQSHELGDYRYDIWGASYGFFVTVSPVVDAPEPASLGIAVCGLAVAAVGRRWGHARRV